MNYIWFCINFALIQWSYHLILIQLLSV